MIGIAVDDPTVPADTPESASVIAPLSLAVASPDAAEKIYFLTLERSDFLFVPVPPSSTIISSASARSAPMSSPPSMSNASMSNVPSPKPPPVSHERLPLASLTNTPLSTAAAGNVYV